MNNARLADQRSRDHIASELQRNLLVEAGAGSGKTHEMSSRMAAGIASGDYQVEHIAAVTFTRKAAAELRGRFQLALEEELEREENDQSELLLGEDFREGYAAFVDKRMPDFVRGGAKQ